MKLSTNLLTTIMVFYFANHLHHQKVNLRNYVCFGQNNMAGLAPAQKQNSWVTALFRRVNTIDCNFNG